MSVSFRGWKHVFIFFLITVSVVRCCVWTTGAPGRDEATSRELGFVSRIPEQQVEKQPKKKTVGDDARPFLWVLPLPKSKPNKKESRERRKLSHSRAAASIIGRKRCALTQASAKKLAQIDERV